QPLRTYVTSLHPPQTCKSRKGQELRIMLHEVKDRQKFISDVQCLQDMQHKGDSEYQACLRRQEYRRDSKDEKKQDQFEGQEIDFERSRNSSGSSSKQIRILTILMSLEQARHLPSGDGSSVKLSFPDTCLEVGMSPNTVTLVAAPSWHSLLTTTNGSNCWVRRGCV
ncbi:Hypothetical predicted protein, partial [Marmota monax]